MAEWWGSGWPDQTLSVQRTFELFRAQRHRGGQNGSHLSWKIVFPSTEGKKEEREKKQKRKGGQDFAIFADALTAMRSIQLDALGPCQDVTVGIVGLAPEICGQGNTQAVRRLPRYRGVTGNGMADTFARRAALGKTPDKESWNAVERISVSFLKGKR